MKSMTYSGLFNGYKSNPDICLVSSPVIRIPPCGVTHSVSVVSDDRLYYASWDPLTYKWVRENALEIDFIHGIIQNSVEKTERIVYAVGIIKSTIHCKRIFMSQD